MSIEEDAMHQERLARNQITSLMSKSCEQCTLRLCETLPVDTKKTDTRGQVNYADPSDPSCTQKQLAHFMANEQRPMSIPNICEALAKSGLRNDGKWHNHIGSALRNLISNDMIIISNQDKDKIESTDLLKQTAKIELDFTK